MVELVVKLGLKREFGYLYVVGDGKVWRTALRRGASSEPQRELGPENVVVDLGIVQDPDYDYFLGADGDVLRTPREDPPLVHPPGIFDDAKPDPQRFAELMARAKKLVGPCAVCGRPVIERDPPLDDQGRRRHPTCR